jgi:hypothetical protein
MSQNGTSINKFENVYPFIHSNQSQGAHLVVKLGFFLGKPVSKSTPLGNDNMI